MTKFAVVVQNIVRGTCSRKGRYWEVDLGVRGRPQWIRIQRFDRQGLWGVVTVGDARQQVRADPLVTVTHGMLIGFANWVNKKARPWAWYVTSDRAVHFSLRIEGQQFTACGKTLKVGRQIPVDQEVANACGTCVSVPLGEVVLFEDNDTETDRIFQAVEKGRTE